MILRISLLDIKPEVWREIEVPATYSFWDLHVAIQDAMGWLDCHLHMFIVHNPKTREMDEIGIPDEGEFLNSPPILPGWETSIADYFIEPSDQTSYEYDFGDGWEHIITLASMGESKTETEYPRCLKGERSCPPEDCGGVGGYERLLEIIQDPKHEEYESMMDWLDGGFDPDGFDPDSVSFDNPKERWEFTFLER